MNKQAVEDVIFRSLDDLRERMPELPAFVKSDTTILFGADGSLDSLALVNLIALVEENIESQLGKSIILADERALSQEVSPFHTVGALRDYICSVSH